MRKEVIAYQELNQGWLDSYGQLYSCSSYDHISKAREIIEKHHYPIIEKDGRLLSPDEILLINGWVHIGRSNGFLFHTSCWKIDWHYRHHLTGEQRKFLIPYFESEVDDYDRSRWEEENGLL